MSSTITYYFSKRTFWLTSLFLFLLLAGFLFLFILFLLYAWQYSLVPALPLSLIVYASIEHMRAYPYLINEKPALILTEEKLIYPFKGKEFKWSEIERISLKANEGKAPGSRIVLYLRNSKKIIEIPNIRLKGKQDEILKNLIGFHNRYGKEIEPQQTE